MKLKPTIAVLSLSIGFLSAARAFAGEPQSYQVTGSVIEVKDDVVVVQKGKEKWEIARDSETKVGKKFKAKVGDKITVHYRMTATSIEPKSETALSGVDAPAGPRKGK